MNRDIIKVPNPGRCRRPAWIPAGGAAVVNALGRGLRLGGHLTVLLGCVALRLLAETVSSLEPSPAGSPLQLTLNRAVAAELARTRTNGLRAEQLAVSLVRLPTNGPGLLASVRGTEPIYPASVVKLFYLAAAQRWLEDGRLADSPEFRRGLRDMIVDSSNDATHYVLDLLTGTTSGPELTPDALGAWVEQRQAVNRWFLSLGYPSSINANKKPWCEGPYGREKQAIEAYQPNRNLLTTDATARLFTEIATDRMITPGRCEQMRKLLARDPWAPSTPEDQTTGFIANGLPRGTKLWSKAGWTSQTRHDSALVELPDGRRVVLVIFTTGHANEEDILPSLTRTILATLP